MLAVGPVSMAIALMQCNDKAGSSHQVPTSSTVLLNQAPKYVGSEACQDCHQAIYNDFIHTGKGRSFRKVGTTTLPFKLPSPFIHDTYSGLSYQVWGHADSLFVTEYKIIKGDTIHKRVQPIHYIIGSGNQTMSFLYEENHYFYEIPVTWYARKNFWDLSPGYEKGANTRFDRAVGNQCMHCHNSDVHFIPHSENRFEKVGNGLSCENCHGPASQHIELMKNNPKAKNASGLVAIKQLPIQAQIDICRQCHLEGVTVNKPGKSVLDFKPGMLLSEVADIFIATGHNKSDFGFASHAERLQMSKCYQATPGGITCTKCHDPHKALPQNSLNFYNQSCITCHTGGHTSCSTPISRQQSEAGGCIGCHMYKGGTTDIPHVSSTDHFIRKKPKEKNNAKQPQKGIIQLVNFTADSVPPATMGRAYLEYFEAFSRDPAYLNKVQQYIKELPAEERVRYHYLAGGLSDFSDLDTSAIKNPLTWYYMSTLTERNGYDGLPLLHRATKAAPFHLELKYLYAATLSEKGNNLAAKQMYHELLSLKPYHHKAACNLGFIYLEEHNYTEAERYFKQSLLGNPNYLLARENLVNTYIKSGNLTAALRQLELCIELKPTYKPYQMLKSELYKALNVGSENKKGA